MFVIQTYVKMNVWLNTKDNKPIAERKFTDEEVLAIRADWAASGVTVGAYVKSLVNPKASLITYKFMLHGYTYKYLPMPA